MNKALLLYESSVLKKKKTKWLPEVEKTNACIHNKERIKTIMRLTDYYRLNFTLNYFCFKYLSDCFTNLGSVNKYNHYSTQTESSPEVRISFIERKYGWKLMETYGNYIRFASCRKHLKSDFW